MKPFVCTIALFAGLLLFGCGGAETTVVIISTNDIHSSITNFPSLATLVKDTRMEYPGRVVLVDAGDRWTGNPYVDRAPVKYSPIVELMNALDYDVATFGNHEWDSGEGILAERMAEAEFTNLMANIDPESIGIPGVVPYRIIERGGLKMAFLGLVGIEQSGYPLGFTANFNRAVFRDPFVTADNYKSLRDSCGLYAAVTHMGVEPDTRLAERHPELDLIIGGHSHTKLDTGLPVNGVLVTQTERNLVYAGVTTVVHRKGKVVSVANRLVRLDTVARDPEFAAMTDRYFNEPELRKKVGEADRTLDKIALVNLFSDMMRQSAKADFAFTNMGGMRLDSLAGGDIARADIFMAEPFDNKLVVVDMTEPEIIEFIMNKFNGVGDEKDKEKRQLDLYPSGLKYTITTGSDGNATAVKLDHNFYPERGKTYRVAMSDYVNEQYYFKRRDEGVRIGGTIAEHMFAYLSRHPQVKADDRNRVTIE